MGALESIGFITGLRQGETRGFLTTTVIRLGGEKVLLVVAGSLLPEGVRLNSVYAPLFDSV